MPKIIKNEDGSEEEVFTKEELDQQAEQKLQEERERLEAEKQEAIEKAESEKQELEKQLQGYKDKDYNFSKLRNKKEKDDGETPEEIQSKIEELNKKIDALAQQPKEDIKNDFVKAKVPEDKEVRDKFNYYYDRLGKEAKTKDDILRAANEALVLATGGSYQPDSDNSMFSVGPSQNYRQQKSEGVSEEGRAMGQALGVTDEMRKKYGKKK